MIDNDVLTHHQADHLEKALVDVLQSDSVFPEGELKFPRPYGKYSLRTEMGRGGMGVVYLAEQKSLGREVALKILSRSHHPVTQEAETRFQQEGRLMAKLSHPNIVAIHEFGVEDGEFYFAMELVPGTTLDEYAKTQTPPVEERIGHVAAIARALAYAHDSGIIHRDIKPSNILIGTDGIPKLTDFGLAKVEEVSLTRSGRLMGTPAYMSPEQAAGKGGVDARSDIYSLGIVLYELLNGQPPFMGESVESVIHKVIHEPTPPLRDLGPAISRDLKIVCMKAIEKEPERRYSSVIAFAEDLERNLRGDSVQVRSPGLLSIFFRWILRRKALAALSLVVTFLVVAQTVTTLQFMNRIEGLQGELDHQEELANYRETASLAEEAFDRGAYAEAIGQYDRLRGTEGWRPRYTRHLGICLARTGKRMEAERLFGDYVKEVPGDGFAWWQRGQNYLDLGDIPAAISAYRKSAQYAGIEWGMQADREENFDALIVLVERHFRSSGSRHARADLFGYDPSYHFFDDDPGPTPYQLSPDWKSRFPIRLFAGLHAGMFKQWFDRHGNHPVLLGWRSKTHGKDRDKARRDLADGLSHLPVSRWLRYLLFLLEMDSGNRDAALRERQIIQILAPNDPTIGVLVALRLKAAKDYSTASGDFEALYRRSLEKKFPQKWNSYMSARDLLLEAARCAGLDKKAAEAVRLLSLSRTFTRKMLERDPAFESVREDPLFQAFLEKRN